uniref:Secreted protein n=1 Tax=Xenopus tropicalis TaxID=8364 RepID=A0A803KCD2_XENTR
MHCTGMFLSLLTSHVQQGIVGLGGGRLKAGWGQATTHKVASQISWGTGGGGNKPYVYVKGPVTPQSERVFFSFTCTVLLLFIGRTSSLSPAPCSPADLAGYFVTQIKCNSSHLSSTCLLPIPQFPAAHVISIRKGTSQCNALWVM